MSSWIDSSGFTHLVLCTCCPYIVGPFITTEAAMTARKNHNAEHRADDKRTANLARYHRTKEAQ